MTGRGRVGALLVALAVAAALVAGLTWWRGASDVPTGEARDLPPLPAVEPTAGEPASDPALARFYDQQPAWRECGDGVQCTEVTVPVDWDAPDGSTIGVAVARRPATQPDDRLGALLYNPGGPGASAVDYVIRFGENLTTSAVRERYDLVGFDPRGVGRSAPLDCLTDAQLDTYLAFDADPGTPQGLQEVRDVADVLAAGCAASAGDLLGNVDTVSAARDMDVIRAVLGQERLDYLGVSYGTLLGAHYADLFPQRVGRFVLDAALDPRSSYTDFIVGQAAGMEQALRAYATWCLDQRDCPLSGSVDDAVGQVRALGEQVDEQPLPTGDPARPLTAPLALTGVITPLYEDSTWPRLSEALEAALAGDGAPLLALADLYAQRGPDGTYAGNLLEALPAVTCLDYPVDDDPAAMRAAADRLLEASPTFGPMLAYGELTCAQWPVGAVRSPGPLTAEGAPPILVVGNTGDPATPYAWAVALADQLESGTLLTYEGEGHASYTRGSRCVDRAVDAYLLEGTVWGPPATCSS
ncbi:alpha/beta fold hydrolase [Thalassiella azotivora]